MVSNRRALLPAVLLLALAGLGSSATFISDGELHSHGSTGRNLLQAKKNCPLNFEFMDYTIITSKCQGPKYPADLCCGALLEFACPYREQLNDVTNDCASAMFSYINLRGRYPPGLFASECKGDKIGLLCPADPPQSANENVKTGKGYSNSGNTNRGLFALVVLLSGFVQHLLSC